ncbi:hypothetical protein D9619_004394 [Psilocybe cf. subviscida]|uniref:Uncharacterized protein n=1 Tax=Psilocybe cf. subviscida TaxID=2480587 RepID=A0A8H5F8K5_9AGAR|nr:hypothetical protein D9619_004394 [Psilocybe cf. subviscida]
MGDTCVYPVIQADKLVITGGDFSQTINYIHGQAERNFEAETRKLHRFVSYDAFHDSYKHASPQYHILTPAEEDIINTATNWASNGDLDRCDRVLHLDLSTCTSGQYVAQHIAELFEHQNSLRGTFFFRFPEHTRHYEQLFVTTLAYQLGVNLPDTNAAILGAIRSDPYILTRNTKKQMQRLVLDPLRQISSRKTPNIFIITTFPEVPGLNSHSSITQAIHAAAEGEDYGCVRFLILRHGLDNCAYLRSLDSLLLWDVRLN